MVTINNDSLRPTSQTCRLRDILAASGSLVELSRQLSEYPVKFEVEDLVPIVLAGERLRDDTNDRRNYTLEWTVFCGSLSRDLRDQSLHQASEILANCAIAIQNANDPEAQKDPARDFRQEVAATSLQGLGNLAAVDRVIERAVAHLVQGYKLIDAFGNSPEANREIPGYSSHDFLANAAVRHHLGNFLNVLSYTLAGALDEAKFQREFKQQYAGRSDQ